jgi:hypothetical protein
MKIQGTLPSSNAMLAPSRTPRAWLEWHLARLQERKRQAQLALKADSHFRRARLRSVLASWTISLSPDLLVCDICVLFIHLPSPTRPLYLISLIFCLLDYPAPHCCLP